MKSLELTFAILRHLPTADQMRVGEYIERLHEVTHSERNEALRQTAGCLTAEEAAAFERTITGSRGQGDN